MHSIHSIIRWHFAKGGLSIYINSRLRNTAWATSILAGTIITLYPILTGAYLPTQPYMIPLSQQVNNFLVAGLLVAIALPAIVEYNNHHYIKQIDAAIPGVLRAISESVRSGIALPQAMEQATEKGYGVLSKEFKRVIGLFTLGVNWEDAVNSLNKHIKSTSVRRLSTILIEANQSGGKTSVVLDTSADLFASIEQYKEEQQNNMKPYLLTIYASILVFLMIAFVVITQFLAPLSTSLETPLSMSGNSLSVLDINYYISILFWAAIIEAFFGGLIAGKIGDSDYLAGLRHSIILIVISIICFNLIGGLL